MNLLNPVIHVNPVKPVNPVDPVNLVNLVKPVNLMNPVNPIGRIYRALLGEYNISQHMLIRMRGPIGPSKGIYIGLYKDI